MPPDKDEHKGDTSPFISCELQTDDSHSLPPVHYCSSSCITHPVYRRRESGLKDQEDYAEVLNVFLVPGGVPLMWIT